MFYTSYQPYKPLTHYAPTGQGAQFGFGAAADSMETDTTRLVSQGADIASTLIGKGITARSARKLEQEKRKTAKVTKKYDIKISASKAKQEEARAQAAAAEAEARRVEAEQAAKAQTTKYAVLGGVGLAAVLAGVIIVKTLKRRTA